MARIKAVKSNPSLETETNKKKGIEKRDRSALGILKQRAAWKMDKEEKQVPQKRRERERQKRKA